jgi:hypothetical protein
MCLIVDANCFGCVFNPNTREHRRFVPVYNWLMYGRGGRLIYGGTKYKKEVDFTTSHYRRLLTEIERKGRLLPMSDRKVDAAAIEVRRKAKNDPRFDDEHIVALVIVSRCCVVCTDDKRSYPYLKRRDLYPTHVKPPKIYHSARNAKLCCDNHVVDICQDKKK